MSVGIIQTSILTDIANAIRYQAGVATTYRPSQMAAAVAALDGTDAGRYVPQQYKQLQSGVLSSSVFDDIADAIRAQNGTQAQYQPGDMAQAILDLTWDVGVKARAMLLTDGTLEFNYRNGRSSDVGTISQCWEVDTQGYSSDSARPWHSIRSQVKRAVFDSDWVGAGMTDYSYLFHSMQSLVEVMGFQYLSGATKVNHMFTTCSHLETIWATSFDNTTIVEAAYPLNGCRRLVGQMGYVAPDSAGVAALSFGAAGVLTNPSQDQRTWVWAHLYDTGRLEITASATPDANRTLLTSGRVCANAHYLTAGAMPWYDQRTHLRTCVFLSDVATIPAWSLDYWFYANQQLTDVSGWAYVNCLTSLKQTFNACVGLTSLDLSGLDPSSLVDYSFTFAGCSNLVTIYVETFWALATGVAGIATFYGCGSIVGGNGTVYDGSAYGYARMVVDRAGQMGYLTTSGLT